MGRARVVAFTDTPLTRAAREALRARREAVLQAPPGAGKSTLVPLSLLDEPWLAGRRILMLEPRRVAARAVSRRMASLIGEEVGGIVGYRMRLDTRVSRRTRLEVITEGVLTRMLQSDPALEGVGCVIFDEFHERSLAADLGLALSLDARATLESDLRILVMSATIDGAAVARLLGDAPVVQVPGRQFPVDVRYLGTGLPLLPGGTESPERSCARAVRHALDDGAEGVLAFLPGAGEIERVRGLLADLSESGVRILPLYGELAGEAQDAVLAEPAPGARRVVLATNIAETSLTIPGITAVVDSGLARRARFDAASGMGRLELARISRAAAEQRAGRAGRTAPGRCYRLWSEGAQASLAATTPAEILESDLAPLALELAQWGEGDSVRLAWLDPPPQAMLAQARSLLVRLGALDAGGAITRAGRDMASLPLHPRLAHMLLAAGGGESLRAAARLAAILSERDLLPRSARDPDLRTRLELLGERAAARDVDRALVSRVQRAAAQYERLAADLAAAGAGGAGPGTATAGGLLSLAFPDRIAQRRGETGGRYLLANGRGAALVNPGTLGNSPWIVAAQLDDAQRDARIDLALPVSPAEIERLHADRIVEEESVAWDPRSGAVLARATRRLDALVLEDHALDPVPADLAASAMLDGVRQLGIDALPWDDATRNLRARMEFVRGLGARTPPGWPASDDATLAATIGEWLAPAVAGMTRREHLARVELAQALLARLDHGQRTALEALAPREIAVPSGSHIRVDYVDESAPVISVRLQEVFGLRETPRIGGGTVPVTFKLLSPAQRPVQVTRDLAGFWASSYFDVRREMRGRYPKHHWPLDPLEAAATRGAKRPVRRG